VEQRGLFSVHVRSEEHEPDGARGGADARERRRGELFYFSAKKAGTTDAELAAAADIAAAVKGMNLYTLMPKE
jgi:hypothetical protein